MTKEEILAKFNRISNDPRQAQEFVGAMADEIEALKKSIENLPEGIKFLDIDEEHEFTAEDKTLLKTGEYYIRLDNGSYKEVFPVYYANAWGDGVIFNYSDTDSDYIQILTYPITEIEVGSTFGELEFKGITLRDCNNMFQYVYLSHGDSFTEDMITKLLTGKYNLMVENNSGNQFIYIPNYVNIEDGEVTMICVDDLDTTANIMSTAKIVLSTGDIGYTYDDISIYYGEFNNGTKLYKHVISINDSYNRKVYCISTNSSKYLTRQALLDDYILGLLNSIVLYDGDYAEYGSIINFDLLTFAYYSLMDDAIRKITVNYDFTADTVTPL